MQLKIIYFLFGFTLEYTIGHKYFVVFLVELRFKIEVEIEIEIEVEIEVEVEVDIEF